MQYNTKKNNRTKTVTKYYRSIKKFYLVLWNKKIESKQKWEKNKYLNIK